MEVKCECPRSSSSTVTVSCTSDHPQPLEAHAENCSKKVGLPYWQHSIRVNSDSLSRSIAYSGSESSSSQFPNKSRDNKSAMASWRHPVSACFSPCTGSRRLNRSYSEQKMRCLLTTTIAFCLGISIGALLPFFFTPADILPSSSSLSSSAQPVEESVLSAQMGNLILSPPQLVMLPSVAVDSIATTTRPQNMSLLSPVTFVDSSVNNNNDVEGNDVAESRVQTPVATESTVGGDARLVNGIYWSEWVEALLPKGFSEEDVANWRWQADNSTVTTVEAGCGRMQNRLITYENGKRACCRYRQNFDQIQGEIFSFYLSQLLGIKNLVPSTLDVIESKSNKWASVRNELQSAQWSDDRPVVLTQFVNNLSPAFIPNLLRSPTRRVHPPDLPSPQLLVQLSQLGQVNSSSSENKGAFDEVSELAQWSDLIVFDYLTANLDRMVNNLYNLQWNPSMMEAPAHNLAKDTSTGLLVFLDNESGLLHGYRLLDKYEHYHRLMLDSLCVFRKSTAEAIKRLRSYGSIQPLFKSMLSQFRRSQFLPMIPDKSLKVLNQRIDTVYRQIQKCQSLYGSRPTSKGSNNVT